MALRRAASLVLRQRLQTLAPTPTPKPLNPLPPLPRQAEAAEVAFEAASTTTNLFSTFSHLETALSPADKRLALACLKLGQHLDSSASADPSRVLKLVLEVGVVLPETDMARFASCFFDGLHQL